MIIPIWIQHGDSGVTTGLRIRYKDQVKTVLPGDVITINVETMADEPINITTVDLAEVLNEKADERQTDLLNAENIEALKTFNDTLRKNIPDLFD
jgi:hypothetical protein